MILGSFKGQLRVTGYFGKDKLARRAARLYESPWELSADQAAAAADVMERRCGAPRNRFLVVGYGPRPAGPIGESVAMEFVLKPGD